MKLMNVHIKSWIKDENSVFSYAEKWKQEIYNSHKNHKISKTICDMKCT